MKWSEMTARERDALVAEKVLGWRNVKIKRDSIWGNPPWQTRWLWNTWRGESYSADIAAAWQVVEKMRLHWEVEIYIYKHHVVVELSEETSGPRFSATEDTVPKAICKVALIAAGVDLE